MAPRLGEDLSDLCSFDKLGDDGGERKLERGCDEVRVARAMSLSVGFPLYVFLHSRRLVQGGRVDLAD